MTINKTPFLALCLIGAALPLVSQATIYSLDITSNGGEDAYTPGAGVFGTASTVWNEQRRIASPGNLALVDDTGAASSVTVSYGREVSVGVSGVTGTFASLGISGGSIDGQVYIGGLTAGVSYDLAVYGNAAADASTLSFTVGSTTQSIITSLDWSTLILGTHYTVFHTVADGSGEISFYGDNWTAFQLQPTPVPEPAETASVLGLLGLGAAGWMRRRRDSRSAE